MTTPLTAAQHHQLMTKLRDDRIPAVVLGETTFLINQETGGVSLLGGGNITSEQRELFNLWLTNQYGEVLSDSEPKPTTNDEGLPWGDRVSVSNAHPSLLGIPQYLGQNATRNPINDALLRQTPEELQARMQSIINSGEYDGSYLSTLSDITQAIGESLTELNRQEETDGEQCVSAIEYKVDGESRYITLDGKTEAEAVSLIVEAIRHASAKEATPTFSPVKLKKDQIPEVMAITEWSHFSEPGIKADDHDGILDIHSAYGFDFDTPEFEAHRKKYFEENPNETHYPADHLDKLLAGELDNNILPPKGDPTTDNEDTSDD